MDTPFIVNTADAQATARLLSPGRKPDRGPPATRFVATNRVRDGD
jgi:hypothetical protein